MQTESKILALEKFAYGKISFENHENRDFCDN
jgi:hypothetical protein